MNEDIRKNEIGEEQLEKVSGGYYGEENAPNCEKCGTRMESIPAGTLYYYDCPNCGHSVPILF